MMKRNFFTAALAASAGTAALESGDNPAPVGVAAVFTEQQNLQPKPGVGEEKGGEASLDDVKVAKAVGEDADIADHDEIDTVAESQEHTLALEHLAATAMRFCRMGAALEEIAETAETNLEAGQPMDPATCTMVTTAVDAAGIGAPLADAVALESFEFSANVATEGFVEAIKDRAKRVWAAVAKFARKAWDLTSQKLKRFADYFRGLVSTYAKLEKEGEILNGYGAKPFQNAKYEKLVQNRLYAPASTKSVIAAVDNAGAEYEQLMKHVDGRLASELQALKRAWKTEKAESVIAQMNKVLTCVRPLADMGNNSYKHSSVSVEVNLPTALSAQNTGGLEGTKVVFEEGTMEFSAGIKAATMADIKHLKESAGRAERLVSAAYGEFFDTYFDESDKSMEAYYMSLSRAQFSDEDKEVARKLLVKYSNLIRLVTDLVCGSVFGAAHGYYYNHFGASRWIRFSIAEAKAAAREAGGK